MIKVLVVSHVYYAILSFLDAKPGNSANVESFQDFITEPYESKPSSARIFQVNIQLILKV